MLQLRETALNRHAHTFEHDFPSGKVTVVLGSNNSGKTNLCRLIAGLSCDGFGCVKFGGQDLAGLRPDKRNVAMVYQAFVNYPNLTVAQNIASPLHTKKGDDIKVRVEEVAQMLQIDDLLDRYPHELSGGQQQRLAIARALAREAKILLLDEPLVNLDFKLRESLQLQLRDLLENTETTVIYTSSDPKDAFALGDEVLLLAQGSKLQSGSPLDVYRRPSSLAAMDLLSDPGVNTIELDGATVALRPEHIALEIDGHIDIGGGGVNNSSNQLMRFQLLVSACETSGDESFLHGQVKGNSWVVRLRSMVRVAVGETVTVSVPRQDMLGFG